MDFVQIMQIDSKSEAACLAHAILNTLVYADIFDYPLTADQILRYLTGMRGAPESICEALDNLIDEKVVSRVGQFTMLAGREGIASRRLERQQTAARLWPKAVEFGRIIAHLPFVRMAAVTGSLAMNNIDEDGDIDYLIVTAPGHLWLCRLLVLGVVRLASWRGVRLCPNYLVSESVLELPDHNLYTAHEFAQMVPLFGLDVYQRMLSVNPWVQDFLPNTDGQSPTIRIDAEPEPTSGLRSLLESVLKTAPGVWLGKWEMERKIKRLSRENEGNSEAVFNADLCKGHSRRHGQHTQASLNERLQRLSLET